METIIIFLFQQIIYYNNKIYYALRHFVNQVSTIRRQQELYLFFKPTSNFYLKKKGGEPFLLVPVRSIGKQSKGESRQSEPTAVD